ncbi:uncharacterized protein MJAP1_001615 [Malassezia japonica]|uniref:nitric oxide dioxygenase n=1 Tax=Malassezia japonica TaxID=223818 RepID=A0AAF0JAD2_9BASI|nr:uncharacterized protein MJAP1_001615 [Malassezia japonica]WFD38654.1 hypothetical protein MJAP1_001615 [Malassezia japonica]
MEQCRSELKPEHAEVIRATLPLVGANIEKIAKLFYATMFKAHPELINNLFNRGNQQQGAQQKALAASVATFASLLVNPDAPSPVQLLSRIGHKHVSLGVTEDQYQIVHDNLFGAIVEVLGADVVTQPVAEAWDDVFWIMARTLINMEKDLYSGAGVAPGKVFVSTRIVDRDERVGGIVRFSVESKDAAKPLPAHQPGQYVSVRADLPDGAHQLRQYSLIDSGVKGSQLCFAVKALTETPDAPAGEVSNWLVQNAKVGDDLEISLPFGDLVLNEEAQTPVVLISAGIGVTPMLDKSASTDAFYEERKRLVSQLAQGSVDTWYTDGDAQTEVNQGRFDLSSQSVPADAEYYLCGANEFLQSLRTTLNAWDVPKDRVHFELFTPNDWLLDA